MDNIFELIALNYTAAAGMHEADFTPTTEELLLKLIKHTGKTDITLEEVFMFMIEAGYQQLDVGELYFVWLLKSDHSVIMEREGLE